MSRFISYAVGCFVVTNCLLLLSVSSITIPKATMVEWDGVFGYFPVPRATIASKLEELQGERQCYNKEILTLPKTPILQDFIAADQHVIAISLGTFNATSFNEALKERSNIYSTVVTTLQLFIPFLSGINEMEPIYKLPLGSFVSTDKPIIQPNPAIPTQQVDSLNVRINDMSLQDGQDTFKLSWSGPKQSCSPDDVNIHKLEAYVDEFTVSYNREMDFSICDKIVDDVDFCHNRDILRCELSKNKFNSCQYWSHSEDVTRCTLTKFRVDELSQKFKGISLLDGTEPNAIIAETISGTFGIGLKIPCIDT